MPYTLTQVTTADLANVTRDADILNRLAEREFIVDVDTVTTSTFTSCFGIAVKHADRWNVVHLSIFDVNDMFTGADLALFLGLLPAVADRVCCFGCINDIWAITRADEQQPDLKTQIFAELTRHFGQIAVEEFHQGGEGRRWAIPADL